MTERARMRTEAVYDGLASSGLGTSGGYFDQFGSSSTKRTRTGILWLMASARITPKSFNPLAKAICHEFSARVSIAFDGIKRVLVQGQVEAHVKAGSTVHTDEFHGYDRVCKAYVHNTVAHGKGNYVNGQVHTNTIESFWALFKRGYHGVYHWMSKKHMQRYVNEFTFRFNHRTSEMQNVFTNVVDNIVKTPNLPYKTLTQDNALADRRKSSRQ